MNSSDILQWLKKHGDSLIASVAGFFTIYFFTQHGGIGISPDSIAYTSAARNLIAGHVRRSEIWAINFNKTTMKKLTTEIIINAAPQKIWSILTGFEQYPTWNPFITSITGDVGVGNKITVRLEPPEASGMTMSSC